MKVDAAAGVSRLQRKTSDVENDFSSSVWDSLTEYAVFTITAEGAIATWNTGAERTFGYTRSEIVGRNLAIIFTPEDIVAGFPAYEMQAAITDGRIDRDCWHVRQSGDRFWGTNTVQPLLDMDGERLGFTKVVRDSTERYEAGIALRQSEERFRLLVESVTDYAIFSTGPEGAITLWNSGAERAFGYTAGEIVGQNFSTLFLPEDVEKHVPEQELAKTRKDGEFDTEGFQLRKDGTRFVAQRRLTLLKAERRGALEGFAATAHDVTQRRAMERAMWDRAFHDTLTGLPNRALLIEHLRRSIARTKRHPEMRYALLYLDLTDFKAINDDFGHQVGDKVLKEAAHRIKSCVRPEDVVARLGGDEFTVLLDNIGNVETASALAARIHEAFKAPFGVEASDRAVSASIGIAIGGPLHDTADGVLHDADVAMYEAKRKGDVRTVVFDDSLRERGLSRHQLEDDLRHAVARAELFLEYQPIVTLRDLRTVGFEALLRWQHPQRGLLPPSEFIPVAESTGMVVSIDRWVLSEACRQIRTWQAEFSQATALTVSVNLSAKQFERDDFPTYLQHVLSETGTSAESLKIEITESAIMEKTDEVLKALAGIRALGVGIQVDDFGTGYSSLSYLSTFPLSAIKLDRCFVTGIDQDEDRSTIVRAIIALAHELRLTVVAEGVETPTELQALQALSCELAQGFLFHAPLGSEAARAVIAGMAAS